MSSLALSMVFWACSGELNQPDKGSNYRVEAMLTRDLSTDSAWIIVALTKNDLAYKGADVTIDSILLDTNSAGYFKKLGATNYPTGSTHTLNIQDVDTLDVDLTLRLPGSFVIDAPSNRQFTGSPVPVQWLPSTGAAGYILATEPPVADTSVHPYSAYVTITQGSIPPETFLYNDNSRIVGTHMIYVAAYTGAPIADSQLPFELPATNGYADNVSLNKVTGRVAGMVVAEPDSIHVVD